MTERFDPRTTPWSFDDDEFYELESPHEQIEFLLRYAILAPSGHNRQPWSFQITKEGVEVFADYSRRLRDRPGDLKREYRAARPISACGRHFGFESPCFP